VSAGEDRCIKIWEHGECVQTITLPAISIWSVAVAPNGDIVCGSSDSNVRVFTREETRFASDADIRELEEKVASSAIPQETIGDINKEKLPGLEALKGKGYSHMDDVDLGKKDGQVIMVRNGDSVEAHQWSAATTSWTKIGDVVNAVSQSQRQIYDGIEYDYVFSVDIQEGAPPLKLPYNVSENPYEAAQKFLERNSLDMGYLDTVVKFIEQNTGGVKLGSTAGAADPYCMPC
jgi:phospholipase A-2-activating protein